MLFENFDKKIREAAERHHPAYDEKAWAKMEKMLDKHMPVEENRRRRFLFILFLLAGLGVAGLLVVKPWKHSPDQLVAKETVSPSGNTTQQLPTQNPVQTESTITSTEPVENQPGEKQATGNNNEDKSFPDSDVPLNDQRVSPGNKKNTFNSNRDNSSTAEERKQEKNTETTVQVVPTDGSQVSAKKDIIETVNNKLIEEAKKVTAPVTGKTDDIPVNSITTPGTDSKKDQVVSNPLRAKNKKSHAFLFTVGGGPDISFVRAGEPGKVKFFGGAGIGYMYNNRISVRTGFYSGRKIYSAEPGDYNPPPGFSLYYPYLQKVDANCKIYEVPIAVGYHFGNKDKRQFFVSAAVSSFFMKEETYNYHYKYTPTGPTVSRERSIYDVNKHYFAGFGISGGYTHKLTPRISVTVEPYAKIPLQGVGYGKVKLNSAGVLISAGIQPFGSAKK